MSERYRCSEELLERALRTIPLGSQTFSKSLTQYPRGVSPFFMERGEGSRVWDVDGNEYIDFVNGLLAVSLGYNDPDVNAAVIDQLSQGVTFSLPHRLEMEVAERLVDLVPAAEMVRFGKNGTDATSAAVRLARAYTGREHVAVCGYHGWQDWYIGSTSRNLGVPETTQALTHTFNYNDASSLEAVFDEYPDSVAAVIMEPMNVQWPADGFLEAVRDLAHDRGALLIFDEIITGCRFAVGGAQALFGVTSDVCTFGKGLGNGLPLSAVMGRRDVMRLMEEVFLSGTFGGETLALAAARAVLDKLQREPVIEKLAARGTEILDGLRSLIDRHDLGGIFATAGHPSWSFLVVRDAPSMSPWEIRTLLLQELFDRGILCLGSHNLSYAHSRQDATTLLATYEEVLPMIRDAVLSGTVKDRLRADPLVPLFRVR